MQPTADPDRLARLRRVLPAITTVTASANSAVPLESYSNDAWRIGGFVVRIGHRGAVRRLLREAQLGPTLPATSRYPPVLEHGRVDDLTYTVTRLVPGRSLEHLWETWPRAARRHALVEICRILSDLHAVSWPTHVPLDPTEPRPESSDSQDVPTIIGSSLHPVRSLPLLIERAYSLPDVPRPMLATIGGHLSRLSPAATFPVGDPPDARPTGSATVTHGDLHLTNVIWHSDTVAAVLDYEWAEPGPPERDLEPLIRRLAEDSTGADLADLAAVVRDHAPHLVQDDLAVERAWLYRVAFEIRALFLWGTRPPYPTGHPVPQLATLARGPEALATLTGLDRLPRDRVGRSRRGDDRRRGAPPWS